MQQMLEENATISSHGRYELRPELWESLRVRCTRFLPGVQSRVAQARAHAGNSTVGHNSDGDEDGTRSGNELESRAAKRPRVEAAARPKGLMQSLLPVEDQGSRAAGSRKVVGDPPTMPTSQKLIADSWKRRAEKIRALEFGACLPPSFFEYACASQHQPLAFF